MNAVSLHFDRERRRLNVAISFAKIIADHAVDDENAVAIEGRSENLAPGQVAPFLGRDDPARLDPFQGWRKIGGEIGSRRGAAGDALGATDAFDEPLAEDVDGHEIGPHAFAHDLAADVDHVAVADAMLVHDGAHLHARAEFAALRLGAKD